MLNHTAVVVKISTETLADNEELSTQINPLRRKLQRGRAYDTKACHAQLQKKRKQVSHHITEKKCGAAEDGYHSNGVMAVLKTSELKRWQKDSSYRQRSIAKTVMYWLIN